MQLHMRDSERGSILILTALSMTVLLGIAALSIDISFMYDKRNRLHAAADAAAKSGAFEVRRDSVDFADRSRNVRESAGVRARVQSGRDDQCCRPPSSNQRCVHRRPGLRRGHRLGADVDVLRPRFWVGPA